MAAAGTMLSAVAASPSGKRPNLLFVFTDQQSHDMLGCAGNDQIITPNLDRFAAEGLRFTQCVSQQPVCTPFRSMLLSGQHTLCNGCLTNDLRMLPGKGNYFGEVLGDAGYCMGYIGKWHLLGGDRKRPIPPGPLRYGFDGTFLSNNCTMDFRPGHAYFWNERGEKEIFDEWEPYAQTRQAMEFLEQCSADEPFALFLSWHAPHDHFVDGKAVGYTAPAELMAKYERDAIRFRPNTDEELFAQRQKRFPGYSGQSDNLRDDYHGYYAMCTGIDIAFGWLMDKLEEKGLDRNTIVVFTSDHGCSLGAWTADIQDLVRRKNLTPEQAMKGVYCGTKGTPHDWSSRTPLLVRWPGRIDPGVSDVLFGTLDFMPTLLGMMNLRIPSVCQGTDLSAHLLRGADPKVSSMPIFSTWYRGVQTPRYTYATSGPGRGWLWDREKDPWQMHNLFDDKNYADIRQDLHKQTLAYLERFDDHFPNPRALTAITMGLSPDADPKEVQRAIDTQGVPQGRPIDLARDLPSVLPGLKN